MQCEAEVSRSDDAPPPSGVRPRVLTLRAASRAREPVADVAGSPRRDEALLAEVAQEVFFEIWSVVRVIAPLQGRWLRVGLAQLAAASLHASTWQLDREPTLGVLRRRWPELVPGSASVDRLAHVMVDALCG